MPGWRDERGRTGRDSSATESHPAAVLREAMPKALAFRKSIVLTFESTRTADSKPLFHPESLSGKVTITSRRSLVGATSQFGVVQRVGGIGADECLHNIAIP